MIKGFTMDDERLKNPDGRPDYFDELLERIREIRASEKRFYQKVRHRWRVIWLRDCWSQWLHAAGVNFWHCGGDRLKKQSCRYSLCLEVISLSKIHLGHGLTHGASLK